MPNAKAASKATPVGISVFKEIPQWLMADWHARIEKREISVEDVFLLARVWEAAQREEFLAALGATFNPPTNE